MAPGRRHAGDTTPAPPLRRRHSGAAIREEIRVQRRLFLLFLLLMFLPAATIMLVNWQTSQRHLAILDSPGLGHSLEASLDLARGVLVREKAATQAVADALLRAAEADALQSISLPENCAYSIIRGDETLASGGAIDPRTTFPDLAAQVPAETLRRRLEGADYLIATAGSDNSVGDPGNNTPHVIVAQTLAPDLVAAMDAVVSGSSAARQMRLYYSRLLRSDTLLTLALLAIALLLVSLWLSRYLSRQIARPLQQLVAGTEQIAAGDLDYRVEVVATDELGELVSAFNRMTGQLQRSKEELLRAERIAAWQGIARRLAHEIKNPLTPITLAMHRVGKRSDDPALQECVTVVLEEAENLRRLADEFSLYARLPEPECRTTDLHDLLQQVVELYLARSEVQARWIGWESGCRLQADPGQLRQLFANLIKNATEAMAGSGELTIELRQRNGAPIEVLVRDTGPGFEGDPEALFEPYLTTKAAGTGLGLAIARKIAVDHGGNLVAASGAKSDDTSGYAGGAVFTVSLPGAAGPDPQGDRS